MSVLVAVIKSPKPDPALGKKLQEMRQAIGGSVAEVARALGIPILRVVMLERGECDMEQEWMWLEAIRILRQWRRKPRPPFSGVR